MRASTRATGPLVLALLLCAGAASAQPRFLSGRSAEEPGAIARRHLFEQRAALGLTRADLETARERRSRSARSGTTHLRLRQRVRGLEVVGGDLGVSVDREGRVFARWSHFVAGAAARTNVDAPLLTPEAALAAAASALELPAAGTPAVLEGPNGADQATRFAGGALSRDAIPLNLVYAPRGQELRLAWNLVIRTPDGRHWWDAQIDAVDGALLGKSDWIAREAYRVYPLPLDSPDEGPRTLESGVADATASPYGWHDTDGIAGAEFTDTRGNNVSAQEDQDGNDVGGARPDGGAPLDFDFPIDFAQTPSSYTAAATTNLFYWNNLAHDLFYQYGFDEASGNFQENNYGRGGLGGDSVDADAQDGSDTNNAQFGTPPDGSNPRMEMFVFTGLGARVDVTAPAAIADFYPAATAEFGPPVGLAASSGSIVQALDPADGAGPSTTDGCSALSNAGAIAGNLAIIDRGTCTFVEKVKNAQDAGAVGAIIANNAGDGLITMAGIDPTVTIPSLFVGQSDGATIAAELGGGVSAGLRVLQNRDSSLDAGIVLHEYGHGVSNRLTGGAANANCLDLSQSRSMGEGWSDYFALAFTAKPGEVDTLPREIGTYVLGNPKGPGIRTHPYTTDLAQNPLTFDDVPFRVVPHGVGTVWATTLWEAYWELVNAYGFDPDFYAGTGGNQLATQLVVSALALQPCDPTFLEARDALLQADLAENGAENECYLWRAFAKRGMGPAATISSNPAYLSGLASDFSVPSQCDDFCGDGTLDAGEECDEGDRIAGDGCAADCRMEFEYTFSGTAAGGNVTLVVEGVMLVVATSAGESAPQVAASVAAAIEADATLAGLGVSAAGFGARLVTTGSLDSVTIHDPGLAAQPVPLAAPTAGALGLLLLGLGSHRLAARAAAGRN